METILGEHTMRIGMQLGVHYGRALSEILREWPFRYKHWVRGYETTYSAVNIWGQGF